MYEVIAIYFATFIHIEICCANHTSKNWKDMLDNIYVVEFLYSGKYWQSEN